MLLRSKFDNVNNRVLKILMLICFCSTLAFIGKGIPNIDFGVLKHVESELEWRMKGPLKFDDAALVEYLKRRVLIPPSTKAYNFSSNAVYLQGSRGLTWGLINRALKSLFSDTRNGFFVEAGALDGEYLSNSLWLERTLNWTGLLVEPDEHNFRDMVWKRRKAWLSHSCLSNEKFPKETILVSTRRKEHAYMAALTARGSSFLHSYINKWNDDEAVSQYLGQTDFAYRTIRCFPLYTSLLALNVSVIDFLSLDIQGAEMDVFDTIPLDQISIRSFVIEDTGINGPMNYDLIERFHNLGFGLFAAGLAGPDYFFVNRSDVSLMRRIKGLGKTKPFIDPEFHFNISRNYYLINPL